MSGEPQSDAQNDGQMRAQRLELILRELETLPTLSSVAVRLLELTTDVEADSREVIRLVASDPALAARVLALCRCHERGRASNVTTIDRAVLLLGFDAVRSAVLAIQVFDVLDQVDSPAGERVSGKTAFDREAYWLHSIAVAVVAESIAKCGAQNSDIHEGEAFMAGLLHDLGQLVLHVLLPESFDRVCQITETHSASLDRACKQIIGIDPHTAGKRLAERWRLPETLIEVIWLNGQPYEALPQVPHRKLIALVTLADALVRARYITPSAHWSRHEDLGPLLLPLGVSMDQVDHATANLHEVVSDRAEALGLNINHDPTILLRAISRANRSLSRMNAGMRQRERISRRHERSLKSLAAFHDAHDPGSPVPEVITALATSIHGLFDLTIDAAAYEALGGGWQLVSFGADGRPLTVRGVEAPGDSLSLASVVMDVPTGSRLRAIAPWMVPMLDPNGDADRIDDLELLPLPGARGGSVVLVAHPKTPQAMDDIAGLIPSWRAALAAGAQRDSAGALTEQLATANRELMDIQRVLARSQTMATLGEVAAGAAHEMNNPLTVISGRSQLLAAKIKDPHLHQVAQEIAGESERLSAMISALRSFAEPVEPKKIATDFAELVVRVVQRFGPGEHRQPQVNTVFTEPIPHVLVDPELLGTALGELVRNAVESKGSTHVELRVQTDRLEDRLKIEVRDDGAGLSEHALRHAFDPFYSEKPAGRQPGLGLARASRFVDAHGGTIDLTNGPSGGAVATIWLSDWRAPARAEAA